jgi:hypothetical protein
VNKDSTASTQGAHPDLTCNEILAAIENAKPTLMRLSEERVAAEARIIQFMKDHGFDPADGCILVLPLVLEGVAGPFPPKFVMFSSLVSSPVLARRQIPHFEVIG